MNDKAQLAHSRACGAQQVAQGLMQAGVTLADPVRLDVRGTLTHGQDVAIDVNVVIEGACTSRIRVRIGPGCVI